ncbi:hypothetical protein OF83DRAFT_1141932 [Amylostereum chailletii]|nr:hypothetical protein OF83DRAFT_1141932 [Amylostereum chailletii]
MAEEKLYGRAWTRILESSGKSPPLLTMKSAFVVAIVSALSASAQSPLTINTPASSVPAIQCQVFDITWTGGVAPFALRLNDVNQDFIEEIGTGLQGPPFAWTVNQPSGLLASLVVTDAEGDVGVTAPFTIQPSDDTSCLSS